MLSGNLLQNAIVASEVNNQRKTEGSLVEVLWCRSGRSAYDEEGGTSRKVVLKVTVEFEWRCTSAASLVILTVVWSNPVPKPCLTDKGKRKTVDTMARITKEKAKKRQ